MVGALSHTSLLSVAPGMPSILLVNPASRQGGRQFERYRDLLAAWLNLADAAATESRQDMISRIRQGLDGGVRRFIIGGGDGTLSAAADALAGTAGILGVLPLGTGNTFSAGLAIPPAPEQQAKLLARGPVSRYDVGIAVKDSMQTTFLNTLTMGFSQRLVELLTRESKDRLGYWAWIFQFRAALASTPTLRISLDWPSGREVYETRQLVVVNGRTIAARIAATPASSAQDGLLEVFRMGDPSLASILRLGTKLLTGRIGTDNQANYRAVSEVAIEAEPALPVSIDGDVWLPPPLSCRVMPAALWVIAPAKAGQRNGRWPFGAKAAAVSKPPLVPWSRTYSMHQDKHNPPVK